MKVKKSIWSGFSNAAILTSLLLPALGCGGNRADDKSDGPDTSLPHDTEDTGENELPQWFEFTYDRTSIALARYEDDLWVGTTGGLYKWNTTTNTYEKFTVTNNGLSYSWITDMAVDSSGVLWATTPRGLNVYDGETWKIFNTANSELHGDSLTSIFIDSKDEKWIGSYENGLAHVVGETWTTYDTSNSDLADNCITSVEVNSQGEAWVGHCGNGASHFDGSTWTNYTNDGPGLSNASAWVKAIDPNTNNVWFWSYGEFAPNPKVDMFDGTSWHSYDTTNSGLLDDNVSSIAIDAAGMVWFSTAGGLSRFDGATWESFGGPQSYFYNLLITNIRTLAFGPNDEVWIGSTSGFSRFDGAGFTDYTTDDIGGAVVRDIAIGPDNTPWVATTYGLNRFTDGAWEFLNSTNTPLPAYNSMQGIEFDLNGDLWCAMTIGGVCQYDGTNWTIYSNSNSGLHSNSNTSLAVGADNAKWFVSGTYGNTISRYFEGNWSASSTEPAAWPQVVYGDKVTGTTWFGATSGAFAFDGESWTHYDTSDGLVDNNVKSIAVDQDGNTWFGTRNGISKYNGEEWTNYSMDEGFPDGFFYGCACGPGAGDCDWIQDIAVDANNKVWFGTWCAGVLEYEDTRWYAYTDPPGLRSPTVSSVAVDQNNNKWFGTNDGISVYNEAGVSLK